MWAKSFVLKKKKKKKKRGGEWRKFKLWSPSPEGKLACHLCRLSSHSHHPWKRERGRKRREMQPGKKGRRMEGETDCEHERRSG